MTYRRPRFTRLLPGACLLMVIGACGGGSDESNSGDPIEIRTLSNRADLISGGDALIEVKMPESSAASGSLDDLRVALNGRDLSESFTISGNRAIAVVDGLQEGSNKITANANDARPAQLTIINAGRGGPILSGEQAEPYYCATATPQLANGNVPALNQNGLTTDPVDAQCNVRTEYKLYYRSTVGDCSLALPDPTAAVSPDATEVPAPASPPSTPCFKPYNVADPEPTDLASTTTDAGLTVPYIVRVERGALNRGLYDIAVLFDPAKAWNGSLRQPQWNGKVIYQFGASTGQPRRQARPQNAWTNDAALARGFLIAANSMTDSARNSNRVLMAETLMMMKELIIDQYGSVSFTIGTGCSGGSINSNQSASISPGLLDGIVIFCTYPDAETTGIEVGDCVQLVEAYQKPEWMSLMTDAGYTEAQINARKAAINGHPDQTGCHGWFNAFGSSAKTGNYNRRIVADNTSGSIVSLPGLINNCELPASAVYDAATNPTGVRCDGQSWAESVWGRAQGVSLPNSITDNTGVQYGLKAFLSNAITAEEFVTLNEIVGSRDRDGNAIDARSVADVAALELAYRAGIVASGKNLAKLPIIDLRGWDDSALLTPPGQATAPVAPIHFVWRSFALRERLDRDYGDHANHVMWRFGRSGLIPQPALLFEALLTMDAWLTSLTTDLTTAPIEERVRSNRPVASAYDFCLLSSDTAQSERVTDFTQCDADPFLKAFASPRQVAGGGLAENVLKCQLKALDVADYLPATLTGNQLARLQLVFPDGVCDWTKPGVGQQDPASPLSFATGPGGRSLGEAPRSQAQ